METFFSTWNTPQNRYKQVLRLNFYPTTEVLYKAIYRIKHKVCNLLFVKRFIFLIERRGYLVKSHRTKKTQQVIYTLIDENFVIVQVLYKVYKL